MYVYSQRTLVMPLELYQRTLTLYLKRSLAVLVNMLFFVCSEGAKS